MAYGANKRTVGLFPEMSLRNVVAERTATNFEKGFALIGRPGYTLFADVGTGPIRGIAQKSGLFGDDAIVVSNTTAYRIDYAGVVTAMTGTIPGRMLVSMDLGRDGNGNDIGRIATGDGLFSFDGTTVTEEDFPDATRPGATSVAFHRGFWIAVQADSEVAYYQIPGDTTWDALSFASAEYQPDKLKAVLTRGDQIFLMGGATTEVWALTGDATVMAPYGGLSFDFGIREAATAVSHKGVAYWVDDNCVVRMSSGGLPEEISDHGVSEDIRKVSAGELRAWAFGHDQHVYYVLSSDSWTWVFDRATKLWTRFNSKGYDYWRAHLGCDTSGTVLAIDANPGTGYVFKVSSDYLTDNGDEIRHRFPVLYETWKDRPICANVRLFGAVGVGNADFPDPVAYMRFSDDRGRSWSDWEESYLGEQGDGFAELWWHRLGQIRPPGRIFEFESFDGVVTRYDHVEMNA